MDMDENSTVTFLAGDMKLSERGDKNSKREDNPHNTPTKWQTWRPLIAYWLLGLCNNYGYVVMLSAAHDIIFHLDPKQTGESSDDVKTDRHCNYMSTGAILLADIVPSLIVKMLAPFLPFFIRIRVLLCILLSALGYLFVGFADTEILAITGVVLTSMSSGLGEVSFLQYSSLYHKNVVSTWSSGTGGAGILGAVSYAGLSALGTKAAMLSMLIVPLVMFLAFFALLPKPGVVTCSVNDDKEHSEETVSIVTPVTGFKNKLKLIPGLLKFMAPLTLVYMFEYFINQGMFELINFENIFLKQDEQYRWLQVLYQVGVFISRSSVNIIHIKKTWLLAVLQFLNVIVFTSESIWYFIPSIWVVFLFTIWEGLLGGAAYVNTFYKISVEVPEEKKQFSMSVTSLSDTIGITLAGVFSIPSHNAICGLPKPTKRWLN